MSEKRQFVRVHPDSTGVHRVCVGKDEIKIEGREIYETSKKAEIDALSNDPSVTETVSDDPENTDEEQEFL